MQTQLPFYIYAALYNYCLTYVCTYIDGNTIFGPVDVRNAPPAQVAGQWDQHGHKLEWDAATKCSLQRDTTFTSLPCIPVLPQNPKDVVT